MNQGWVRDPGRDWHLWRSGKIVGSAWFWGDKWWGEVGDDVKSFASMDDAKAWVEAQVVA